MNWRSVAATAAWVAVCTGAGGLGAWQLAGADADPGPHGRRLDDAAVRRALASATSAPPGRAPSTTAPAPADRRHTVRFTGGSATVECGADGSVYLVAWSPADGYEIDTDDVVRGPGRAARVKAEPSGEDGEDAVWEIRCEPLRAEQVPESDD
ncbi:hypothetical protein ACIBL6_34610 [Streptomyces sp. NPDC050400]|uniref:hypothetical protein n=1 Tax=Streptomyces sp. NPDC050400 TaxID=3365610 RepID=UPI003790EA92